MKKKKTIEPKNPFEDEDEESNRTPSQIAVGDIMVTSRGSLLSCKKTIKGLLKDKSIRNYLNIYKTKKFLSGGLDYIG